MNEKLQGYIDWIQYDELMNQENNCPHKLLGRHEFGGHQAILAYRPDAEYVKVTDLKGNQENYLDKIDDRGFFALYLEDKVYDKYLLEIKYPDGTIIKTRDPYSFDTIVSEMDLYLFAESNHYEIYEKLGAHPMTVDGVEGTLFAVWAPNARAVSLVGDFNCWDGRIYPMKLINESGVYEIFIPGVSEGAIYKYRIRTRSGEMLFKTDPYGNCSELRPNNASVVTNLNNFKWTDTEWMEKRAKTDRVDSRKKPMSIYEVHLGSWKKDYSNNPETGFINYRELAKDLGGYLVDMGYTHLELMGIAEHPFDGSWGYQVTGYYAPTRRYGLPEDFMYFVDYMHSLGISVILDWVPAHFPKDANSLGRFDGTPLYEHPDTRKGEHPHWGTYVFNYEKTEVANFLLANALFWIEKFHIDGLRVDAVASMLYLDYGREDGQWVPNKFGGKENLAVIEFLRHLNKVVEERVPGAMMIAEESTAWAGVTSPVALDGLGFTFKWNMGWMNDFLEYMKLDPYFRKPNHNKLTFSMMYAYSENFIQVLSHDEVVHGKCSMIQKMPGLYDDKFANLKVGYGFMYGHPGKKLLFMGQEFAQWNEWSEEKSLDWHLLGEEKNAKMKEYVKALNKLYIKYPAMYYNDFDPIGFEWMDCDNADDSIVAFVRRGNDSKKQLLFVCNFTPMWKDTYRIAVPCKGKYIEVLNSDAEEFGGYGTLNKEPLVAEKVECNGKDYSFTVKIPPLSTMVFEFDYVEDKKVDTKLKEEADSSNDNVEANNNTTTNDTNEENKDKDSATKVESSVKVNKKGSSTKKSATKKNSAKKSATNKKTSKK